MLQTTTIIINKKYLHININLPTWIKFTDGCAKSGWLGRAVQRTGRANLLQQKAFTSITCVIVNGPVNHFVENETTQHTAPFTVGHLYVHDVSALVPWADSNRAYRRQLTVGCQTVGTSIAMSGLCCVKSNLVGFIQIGTFVNGFI